jgi:membrane protein
MSEQSEAADKLEVRSSSNAAQPSASSSDNTTSGDEESHSSGPGAAAKRLLEADDADRRHEPEPPSYSLMGRLRRYGASALRYLLQTEVHTYAFSVAANALLSLFPFMVLLLTLTRRVFHSINMYNVMIDLLRQFLPSNQDFVIRNLQFLASVRGRGQLLSVVMLLITSTGIFMPLEVALNRIWGFKKNRSYLLNQMVALGLAIVSGILTLLSIAATAQSLKYLGPVIGDHDFPLHVAEYALLKVTALLATIAIYFLIYWLLPNGRVPVRAVLPAAVIMGILTEGAKYLFVLLLPWLNFQDVYGPFSVSVTFIMWAWTTGMLLLLGAYLSAARHSDRMRAKLQEAADAVAG